MSNFNFYNPVKQYHNVITIKVGGCSLSTSTPFLIATSDSISDLGVFQTTDKLIYNINENLTYKLLIANLGPSDTPSVNLINIFSSNCSLINISLSQGNYRYSNNKISFHLGPLSNGDTAEIAITVRPYCYGIIENFAWVNNPKYDSNLNNNFSTLKTKICDSNNCSFYY